MTRPNTSEQLLKDRDAKYGQAWYKAGLVLNYMQHVLGLADAILGNPFSHNWIQILGKLMRSLATPRDPEHWRDIAGYAQLVVDHLADEGGEDEP